MHYVFIEDTLLWVYAKLDGTIAIYKLEGTTAFYKIKRYNDHIQN